MEKKKRRNLNFRKAGVTILFAGVLVYAGYTLLHQQIDMLQKQKTVAQCETMVSDAKGEKARLEEELGLVETDEYRERKARELLGYIKPDERIYIDVTK